MDLIDEPLTISDINFVLAELTSVQIFGWTVPTAKVVRHLEHVRKDMALTGPMSDKEMPLEEQFKNLLLQARILGEQVKQERPSREHSIAITNLETATLWARFDIEKKALA